MNKLELFTDKKIKLDLPTLVDSRALVCANSGGGKSYSIRKLLEESHDKVMTIVLDVEGEFKTLREQFDFLLIGHDGDVDVSLESASLLPEKLLELNVSTIVDISDLKRHERITYVKEFLEALLDIPRKSGLWKPCLIFLDEAHLLCGQQEKQDSYGAVIDLMTRGRKRGYCGILCTQRIAKLHKDAVAEANNIMIGRTGLDIDMKRASEILGFTSKKDMLSLRDLDPGEFYVFGTAISKYVKKVKISEVKTTHPKVGMDKKIELSQPTTKIKKMLSKLSDLPQEAKKELKTTQDMKTEILRLKKELRIASLGKPKTEVITDQRTIDRARHEGYREAENVYSPQNKELKRTIQILSKKLENFARAMDTLNKIMGMKVEIPKLSLEPIKLKPQINSIPQVNVQPVPAARIEPVRHSNESYEDGIGICAKKIYSFLYHNSNREFTKSQVGAVTGYSHKSGGFNNAISQLRIQNLITRKANMLQANEMNAELIVEFDFSKEAIINKMGVCPKKIYRLLLDNPYTEFSKEDVGEATGYSSGSGGFNNAISYLKTLGLIERQGNIIKLNPEILDLE